MSCQLAVGGSSLLSWEVLPMQSFADCKSSALPAHRAVRHLPPECPAISATQAAVVTGPTRSVIRTTSPLTRLGRQVWVVIRAIRRWLAGITRQYLSRRLWFRDKGAPASQARPLTTGRLSLP